MFEEALALPLALTTLLALAQLEAANDALGSVDAEAVSEAVLVALKDKVVRPLPLLVLLALAQLVAAELVDAVVEPLLVCEGDVAAVGSDEVVPEMEEESVAFPVAEPLGDTVGVVEADRHKVGVDEKDGDAVAQGEAEALAHQVGRREALAEAVEEREAEPLAQKECDPVLVAVVVAQSEGVGEPEEETVPQPVGEALTLRDEAPDELPLAQREAEAVVEALSVNDVLAEALKQPLAENVGELVENAVRVFERVVEWQGETVCEGVLNTVGVEDTQGVTVPQREAVAEAELLLEGVDGPLRVHTSDMEELTEGDTLPLAHLENVVEAVAHALAEPVTVAQTETERLDEAVVEDEAQALPDAIVDCEGLCVGVPLLLTEPEKEGVTVDVKERLPLTEKVAQPLGEAVKEALGDPEIELVAQGEKEEESVGAPEAENDGVPEPDSVGEREVEKLLVAHAEEHADGVPVLLGQREPENEPECDELPLWERALEAVNDTVPDAHSDGEGDKDAEMVGHTEAVAERVPVLLPLREAEGEPVSDGDPLRERVPEELYVAEGDPLRERASDAVRDGEADWDGETEWEDESEDVKQAVAVRDADPQLLPLLVTESVPEGDDDELTVKDIEKSAVGDGEELLERVGEFVKLKVARADPEKLLQLEGVNDIVAHRVGEDVEQNEEAAVEETLSDKLLEEDAQMEVNGEPLAELVGLPVKDVALEGDATLADEVREGKTEAEAQAVEHTVTVVEGVVVPV